MNHLAAARKDQQKRINSRSMIFTGYDKIDLAAQQLWTKFLTTKYADSKQVNHDQFDILLNEWKIEVDPNVSAEIYFELLQSSEDYDKEEESTKAQSPNGTSAGATLTDALSNSSNNDATNIEDSLKAKQKAKIEQNTSHVSKTGNRYHSDLLSLRQQYELQQTLLPTLNENNTDDATKKLSIDPISEDKETNEKTDTNGNNNSQKKRRS